jgi:hypothetical protein
MIPAGRQLRTNENQACVIASHSMWRQDGVKVLWRSSMKSDQRTLRTDQKAPGNDQIGPPRSRCSSCLRIEALFTTSNMDNLCCAANKTPSFRELSVNPGFDLMTFLNFGVNLAGVVKVWNTANHGQTTLVVSSWQSRRRRYEIQEQVTALSPETLR